MTTLDDIRRFAATRSLPAPTTLAEALTAFGFVQADPIRAPARAQDLTLRHRVTGYRAGDLERHYEALDAEEDVFINYGYVSRDVYALMHPRGGVSAWTPRQRRQADAILAFIASRGAVHPRDVHARFQHGTVTNYWGGSSNATTHLMDLMHYHGLLRVQRRDNGIRVYAPSVSVDPSPDRVSSAARLDALVDVVVTKYAPVPAPSLSTLISRLRYAVPQFRRHLPQALARARQRLAHAAIDGIVWYWPAGEEMTVPPPADDVRLLAPFDPVVWDRRRFEILWQWAYRFEAYTPLAKRKLGYYALPLLWRDRVIGWANVSVASGASRPSTSRRRRERLALDIELGYVAGRPPRERGFKPALEKELAALSAFLTPSVDEAGGPALA